MIQSHTNPARNQRLSIQLMLLTALMLGPRAIECQSPPASRPPNPARSGGAVSEISAEEIFRRFASRVLLLTCDLSADEYALGSGVLVSADGFVVTNAHVVEGCRSMNATQITGTAHRSYAPVLKYYDKKSDTAVLKIAGQGFDFFPVDARPVRPGERVYAIGNPLGLTQTITEGIVSGNREDSGQLWIQHSAPISHGSSGGALISAQGQLLGINSWFPSEESQGLFFAVPGSTLAGACSRARAVTGFLPKFPASRPVTQTQAPVMPSRPAVAPSDINGTFPVPPPAPSSPVDPDRPVMRRGSPTVADSGSTQPPLLAAPALNNPLSGIAATDPIIDQARQETFAYAESLSNFTVRRYTTRYLSDSASRGQTTWKALNIVTVEMRVQRGAERYKNFLVNGAPAQINGVAAKEGDFEGRGLWFSSDQTNSWSEGEFAAALQTLLSPASNARFTNRRLTAIINRSAYRYDYWIEQPQSTWHLEAGWASYRPAYAGAIWIDKETSRVLRIEMSARNVPTEFPLDQIESTVDYDFVLIGEKKYLLPTHSEALSCVRGTSECRRNVTVFRNYNRSEISEIDDVIHSGKYSQMPRAEVVSPSTGSGPSHMSIVNQTVYALTVTFYGSTERSVNVTAGQSLEVDLAPGRYRVLCRASSLTVLPFVGNDDYEAGGSYASTFYVAHQAIP